MSKKLLPKKNSLFDVDFALKDRNRLFSLKSNLSKRAEILMNIRRFFSEHGFIEVETPLRIPAPAPELHIDTEPSGERFLAASPELQMKRLAAAGYDKIFQICKCFRKGERGDRHLPEFTMLEWYRLGGDMQSMAEDCENLVRFAANSVGMLNCVERNGFQIDLTSPFLKWELSDAFEKLAGFKPGLNPDPEQFDLALVDKVEPGLPPNRPVFLCGYPSAMASLAKIDTKNPERALRLELYAGGLELANGFCELTNAEEQKARFEKEEADRRAAGKPPYPIDTRFLSALSLGMNDCAGIALGVDRLVMLLLNAASIDEVTAFPEGTL